MLNFTKNHIFQNQIQTNPVKLARKSTNFD